MAGRRRPRFPRRSVQQAAGRIRAGRGNLRTSGRSRAGAGRVKPVTPVKAKGG